MGLSDFGRSNELAATYTRLITSKTFLDSVQLDGAVPFGPRNLPSLVSAETDSNPPVINLKVKYTDPAYAAITAQIVADQFIVYIVEQRLADIARLQSAARAQGITDIQDLVSAQLTAVDSLSLLDPVSTPGAPLSNSTQNILLGTLMGIVLATGLAMVLENLSDTVRFPDQISRRFGVTSLGTVFRWPLRDVEESSVVMSSAPSSGYAEALRQIRANIQFTTVNQPGNVHLVTSPGPGEGKSTLLANLAVASAQTGKTVVIVDGDMRRPSAHRFFPNITKEPGLSSTLADANIGLPDIIRSTSESGVDLIPSGPHPPNPSELLGSPRMATLLRQLAESYDMVFVDSPPVLILADASILAAQSDKAIVVVDGLSTKSSSLSAALDTLRSTQVGITGVIINKLKHTRLGYGYRYPYYYYNSQYYLQDDSNPSANGSVGPIRRLARRVMNKLRPGRDR